MTEESIENCSQGRINGRTCVKLEFRLEGFSGHQMRGLQRQVSLLLLIIGVSGNGVVLNVGSRDVVGVAAVALSELRQMSDSGVYETLELRSVRRAEVENGRFFENMILDVVLGSEFLKADVETEIVVMRDQQSKVIRSVAVENLPAFPDAIVEQFHERKRQARKLEREKLFADIEAEYLRTFV